MSTRSAKIGPAETAEAEVGRLHAPARSERRLGVGRLGLYVVAGVLAVAGAAYTTRTVVFYMHHVTTDDAQVEGQIDPVLPRVSGYISEVPVRDNERVEASQVLIRIDPRDLESRASMARAALATAQAAVAVAEANVEAVATRRAKAAQDFDRAEALRARHVVSQQDHDTAKAAADTAAAEHHAAVRRVAAAKAEAAQRQADLDYAMLQLSYATITAPAAGFVSKKSVQVGQFVQAGQPLLAVVADGESWVVANFKETQVTRMRPGQEATIVVDAYSKQVLRARVESMAAATGAKFTLLPPDNATGNFVKVVQRIPVKLVFVDPPNVEYPLRVGMSVTATVALD